jgi:CheY-like chemotaxis protein
VRVLLVDDDEMSRVAGRELLRKAGYLVSTASDGREALQQLAGEGFDLVLMDIQMPVMDGIEATRAIRSAPELIHAATIPIIAMTAYAMSGDREKFLAAGMDDYIAKPVSIQELRKVMERVLGPSTGTRPL